MKLPNTIISLIFNEIEEIKWIKLFFLFMDEIEWKIDHHLYRITCHQLKKVCKNGNIFTILKNKDHLYWNGGLYYQNDWNKAFKGACFGGHLNIVKLMIERGANEWNNGLFEACYGGHLNVVNLMIEKGADDWNYGLSGACYNGHLNIVKLMISKGADEWNDGLFEACRGESWYDEFSGDDHFNIINLMIDKGATKCVNCGKSMKDHFIKNL